MLYHTLYLITFVCAVTPDESTTMVSPRVDHKVEHKVDHKVDHKLHLAAAKRRWSTESGENQKPSTSTKVSKVHRRASAFEAEGVC